MAINFLFRRKKNNCAVDWKGYTHVNGFYVRLRVNELWNDSVCHKNRWEREMTVAAGTQTSTLSYFVFFFQFLFVHRARPINVLVGELVLHIAAVNEHRMHTLFWIFFVVIFDVSPMKSMAVTTQRQTFGEIKKNIQWNFLFVSTKANNF